MAINTELTDADTPATAHASRVLVVDDERSMRELLSIVLRRDGYDVLVADNGKTAVDILNRERVDVLITDIRMPEMSRRGRAAGSEAHRSGDHQHRDDGLCLHGYRGGCAAAGRCRLRPQVSQCRRRSADARSQGDGAEAAAAGECPAQARAEDALMPSRTSSGPAARWWRCST